MTAISGKPFFDFDNWDVHSLVVSDYIDDKKTCNHCDLFEKREGKIFSAKKCDIAYYLRNKEDKNYIIFCRSSCYNNELRIKNDYKRLSTIKEYKHYRHYFNNFKSNILLKNSILKIAFESGIISQNEFQSYQSIKLDRKYKSLSDTQVYINNKINDFFICFHRNKILEKNNSNVAACNFFSNERSLSNTLTHQGNIVNKNLICIPNVKHWMDPNGFKVRDESSDQNKFLNDVRCKGNTQEIETLQLPQNESIIFSSDQNCANLSHNQDMELNYSNFMEILSQPLSNEEIDSLLAVYNSQDCSDVFEDLKKF